jgi:hypothetical protein
MSELQNENLISLTEAVIEVTSANVNFLFEN